MKRAVATLKGVSPYSQSRYYKVPHKEKESPADYEERTWKERLHVDKNGQVFIPPMAIKNCLSEIAAFLALQIPGKGKSTYRKHIEAGVLVKDPVELKIHRDQVYGEWLFVPASGRRGDGKRVVKCFPVIPEWQGETEIFVIDDTITEQVLRYHLEQAGQLIGLGRFRPRQNGFYGRFELVKMQFEDYS